MHTCRYKEPRDEVFGPIPKHNAKGHAQVFVKYKHREHRYDYFRADMALTAEMCHKLWNDPSSPISKDQVLRVMMCNRLLGENEDIVLVPMECCRLQSLCPACQWHQAKQYSLKMMGEVPIALDETEAHFGLPVERYLFAHMVFTLPSDTTRSSQYMIHFMVKSMPLLIKKLGKMYANGQIIRPYIASLHFQKRTDRDSPLPHIHLGVLRHWSMHESRTHVPDPRKNDVIDELTEYWRERTHRKFRDRYKMGGVGRVLSQHGFQTISKSRTVDGRKITRSDAARQFAYILRSHEVYMSASELLTEFRTRDKYGLKSHFTASQAPKGKSRKINLHDSRSLKGIDKLFTALPCGINKSLPATEENRKELIAVVEDSCLKFLNAKKPHFFPKDLTTIQTKFKRQLDRLEHRIPELKDHVPAKRF